MQAGRVFPHTRTARIKPASPPTRSARSPAFDVGGYFDTATARWTPPAGKVRLSGGFYVASGAGSSGPVLACLYKNGALFKQFIFGASPAAAAGFFTAVDAANGSDYYEFFCYAPAASTFTVSGHTANTHFSGEQI